jgi:hypothetical protein
MCYYCPTPHSDQPQRAQLRLRGDSIDRHNIDSGERRKANDDVRHGARVDDTQTHDCRRGEAGKGSKWGGRDAINRIKNRA